MAEKSGLWTTGGAAGDQQASYAQADDSDIKRVLAACAGFEGVAVGYNNELACSDGGDEIVDVATGGGIVDGKYFINTAVQNINIPSASGAGNTRIDRIVLRATWASFNVSVTRIAGVDAATPSAPSITQTSETTYDIKLCQVLVDTAGDVTVTDERVWALPKETYQIQVFPSTQYWATGDGKFYITILDPKMDGAVLADVKIACHTPSTSGTPTVQVARGHRTTASGALSYSDMLSTVATIDQDEYSSDDDASQPVVDSTYATVYIGDLIRIDADVAGTGTKGLDIWLEFTL